MPGGYFQLIAQGPADLYLTGNPSISFFKFVYRRYTPFSMELINLPYNTIPSFTPTQSTEAKCNVDRNGDLLHDSYVIYDLPAIYTADYPFSWVESVGNKIIEETSIKANGQNVDRQFGEFMKVYSDLTLTKTKKVKYNNMVNGPNDIIRTAFPTGDDTYPALPSKRLYIPLPFWFCKNSGQSLPLIALQYTQMRIDVIYTRLNDLFTIGNPGVSPEELFNSENLSDYNINMRDTLLEEGWDQTNVIFRFARDWDQYSAILANYIYLAEDERTKFAQTSHEYLITQLQRRIYLGLSRGPSRLDLVMNYPVKELIWFFRNQEAYRTNDWFNFTDNNCPDLLNDVKDIRKFIMTKCLQTLIDNDTCDCSGNGLEQTKNLSNQLSNLLSDTYAGIFEGVSVSNINSSRWDYYSIMKDAKLVFNGHDRFEERENTYFENQQIYKYHTGEGSRGLYVYSFSLKPERDQPSGTCNMSRIDTQQFFTNIFDTDNSPKENDKFDLHMFGINYNIFRIMGGIGNLVFTN